MVWLWFFGGVVTGCILAAILLVGALIGIINIFKDVDW